MDKNLTEKVEIEGSGILKKRPLYETRYDISKATMAAAIGSAAKKAGHNSGEDFKYKIIVEVKKKN